MTFWFDSVLSAQPEPLDDLLVALGILSAKIGQVATSSANHLEKTSTRMLVVLVRLQVLRKLVNPGRKQCYLHLW